MLRLSLHDVPGAIATLRQGGLIRDAAALAAARLLPTDELLIQTRRELAAAEETRGGMEAAAKTHLCIGAPASAVRALTRTTSGGALAAAKLAIACNLTGPQERQTVARAAIELAKTDNFEDAVDLIKELSDLCERERCSVDILATLSATAADEDVVAELVRRLDLIKAS
jgi:gem associated protein 5